MHLGIVTQGNAAAAAEEPLEVGLREPSIRVYWVGAKQAARNPISAHIHQESQVIANLGQGPMWVLVRKNRIELAPRRLIFIPPWTEHALIGSEPSALNNTQLSVTIPGNVLTELGVNADEVSIEPRMICDHWLEDLLRYAPVECGEGPQEASGKPLLLLVFALIASLSRASGPVGHPEKLLRDRRIWQSIEHLSRRSPELPDVRSLARIFGMSRAQFFRRFKATTGVTPVRVMDALRMEYAREALLIKHNDVGSIADELGFSTPSHFGRFFRMHTGSSPTEYQRRAYRL